MLSLSHRCVVRSSVHVSHVSWTSRTRYKNYQGIVSFRTLVFCVNLWMPNWSVSVFAFGSGSVSLSSELACRGNTP